MRSKRRTPDLAERVVLAPGNPAAALGLLVKRLRANRVVSITVRRTGVAPALVPFRAGWLRVSTGAPDLAYKTGALLLPASTVRGREGHDVITLAAPLEVPADRPRRRASEAAAHAYARRLEPWRPSRPVAPPAQPLTRARALTWPRARPSSARPSRCCQANRKGTSGRNSRARVASDTPSIRSGGSPRSAPTAT